MSTSPLPLVELRSGTAQDLAGVSEVMADAFEPRFGEAWTHSQCLGMLSLPGVWLTLARIDERDVGFALSRATLDDSELLLIATRMDVRGKGVGRALLRSVIADAAQRGATQLHLEVRAGNSAVHLYRSEGFVKAGQRPGYYRGKDGEQYDAETFTRSVS